MWKIILPILVFLGFLVVRKILKNVARDYKYQLEYTKYFDELIQNGYKKSDALVEVSQTCHPELSLETHRKIATKFDNINIMLRFLSCARTVGTEKDRLVEKKVLALLEVTTFEKGLIRSVRHTDTKRYFLIIDGFINNEKNRQSCKMSEEERTKEGRSEKGKGKNGKRDTV